MGVPVVWGWGGFKWKYDLSPVFGDGRPRCLGMGVPGVWGWASPLFGDGRPRGSNDFYNNISLENYLKKYLLNIVYMMCEMCKDLKTTTALLCKTALPYDLNGHIKQYLRCLGCDGRERAVKFKTIMGKISYSRFPATVSIAKQMVGDRSLTKYLNLYSFHYLEWMHTHLRDLNNKDIKDFRKTVLYRDLRASGSVRRPSGGESTKA